MIHRRHLLQGSALGAALLLGGRLSFAAAATERRFVFILQRGAVDGLHLVPPVGDPGFAALRARMVPDASALLRLDDTFALHPALSEVGRLYAAGQALPLHAIASPYRERSHFDGQNVLETGGLQPYEVKDGWLNRLAALLPAAASPPLALSPTLPMALRGNSEVASYAASRLPGPGQDLLARVSRLYQQDPLLHPLWNTALQTRGMAAEAGVDGASVGALAASFLARPDGPRIAMVETDGWDTHNQQEARLSRLLRNFDDMLAALRTGLGPHWQQTTVLVATEFGRTAAINGTGGTDHGTGAAALLLGGDVRGGRVWADWPGLQPAALLEGRDLRPTLGLDALIAGTVSEAFGLDPAQVMRALFPGQGGTTALRGLLRS